MKPSILLLALILSVVAVAAAQNAPLADRSGGSTALPGSPEKDVIRPDPTEQPSSLVELTDAASLIVRGFVVSTYPSVALEPPEASRPRMLETYSVIAVDEVIHGAIPGGERSVVLGQVGGSIDGYGLVVAEDTLVQVGEEYILFLSPPVACHSNVPGALPCYAITGVWVGRAKVVESRVAFLPSVSDKIQSHNGALASELITMIRDLKSGKWTVPPNERPREPLFLEQYGGSSPSK